jgi:hypothetical protein
MDRMLATDAEIASMRDAEGMRPLFADPAQAGMSAEAVAPYQRMARRAVEQAEQTLLEKTIAAVRRRREAWWRAETKAVRAEVEAEFATRREFRLVEALANGRMDGEVPVADGPGGHVGVQRGLAHAGRTAARRADAAGRRGLADHAGFHGPFDRRDVDRDADRGGSGGPDGGRPVALLHHVGRRPLPVHAAADDGGRHPRCGGSWSFARGSSGWPSACCVSTGGAAAQPVSPSISGDGNGPPVRRWSPKTCRAHWPV